MSPSYRALLCDSDVHSGAGRQERKATGRSQVHAHPDSQSDDLTMDLDGPYGGGEKGGMAPRGHVFWLLMHQIVLTFSGHEKHNKTGNGAEKPPKTRHACFTRGAEAVQRHFICLRRVEDHTEEKW